MIYATANDTASNLQGKNGCVQTMKTCPAASFAGFKFFVSQWIGAVNHIDLAIVNPIPMHVNISRLVQLSCSFNFTINCGWQLSPAVHSIRGRTCYDFESGQPEWHASETFDWFLRHSDSVCSDLECSLLLRLELQEAFHSKALGNSQSNQKSHVTKILLDIGCTATWKESAPPSWDRAP